MIAASRSLKNPKMVESDVAAEREKREGMNEIHACNARDAPRNRRNRHVSHPVFTRRPSRLDYGQKQEEDRSMSTASTTRALDQEAA